MSANSNFTGAPDRPTGSGVVKFIGIGPFNLPGAATGPGWVVAVTESGTGQVRVTVDGTVPTNTNGYEIVGGSTVWDKLFVADLQQVMIAATAAGSEFSVSWETAE